MKLIYVSGAYTAKTKKLIQKNIKLSEQVSKELYLLGWACITPHKNSAGFENFTEFTYYDWIACDFEMLKRCDAIFMLDNWESSVGARAEYIFAMWAKIPIFFEKNGYPVPENLT